MNVAKMSGVAVLGTLGAAAAQRPLAPPRPESIKGDMTRLSPIDSSKKPAEDYFKDSFTWQPIEAKTDIAPNLDGIPSADSQSRNKLLPIKFDNFDKAVKPSPKERRQHGKERRLNELKRQAYQLGIEFTVTPPKGQGQGQANLYDKNEKYLGLYTGSFEKYLPKGEGQIDFNSKLRYNGGVKGSNCHGKGVLTAELDSIIVVVHGEWKNGDLISIENEALFYSALRQNERDLEPSQVPQEQFEFHPAPEQVGRWSDCPESGIGMCTRFQVTDGIGDERVVYVGYFENGQPNNIGMMKWYRNGEANAYRIYQGRMKDGEPHGNGYEMNDGVLYEGKWKNGVFTEGIRFYKDETGVYTYDLLRLKPKAAQKEPYSTYRNIGLVYLMAFIIVKFALDNRQAQPYQAARDLAGLVATGAILGTVLFALEEAGGDMAQG